jgi:hypothetical protein
MIKLAFSYSSPEERADIISLIERIDSYKIIDFRPEKDKEKGPYKKLYIGLSRK